MVSYKGPVVNGALDSHLRPDRRVISYLFHCMSVLCLLLFAKLFLSSAWDENTVEATLRVLLFEVIPVNISEEGVILDLS